MSQGFPTSSRQCVLHHWAKIRPNDVAFVTDQTHYTWSEVEQRSAMVVSFLAAQGVGQGDTLAIVGKNHPHHIWLFLAAMILDVPVSFIAPGPESVVKSKLDSLSQPNYSLWVYNLAGNLVIPHYTFLPNLDEDLISDQNCLAQASPRHQHAFDIASLATLTFTSGSTGKPKIVAHSHQQHFASASGLLQHFAFTQKDCWLLSLPLYHVSGLAIIYRWLQIGACLKVGNGDLEHDINSVSHASLVPVQLARLLENSALALNLTHVLLGGSQIPNSLCQLAEQRGIETWLGYGMTEAASTVTAKRANSLAGVGHVLPYRKLAIQNQRIVIGGDTLALGYYFQGNLTPLADNQGWFDSNDLGEWRDGEVDGELVVLGRADNMFISGGENIHCEEVEAALMSIPTVNVAMVLPVADKEFGARPIAFIDGYYHPADRDIFERELARTLEKYKWPIDYFSLPDTIMTQGIKLSRHDVIEWFKTQKTHYLVMS